MNSMKRRSLLDQTFRISITLKGIDGVLEIIGGLIVLWISPRAVNYVVAALTEHELSEDPRDFIATHLLSASHGLAHGGKTLAATLEADRFAKPSSLSANQSVP